MNTVEWQAHFSDHSEFFQILRGKNSKKKNHEIWFYKVILLWITRHEIKKTGKIMPTGMFESG